MALQRVDGSMLGEIEDPRRGFELIRRSWIHKYFRDKGIEYNPIMAKQHLVSICEVRGITAKMIAEYIAGPDVLNPQISIQEKRIAELERLVEALAKSSGESVDSLLEKDLDEVPEPMDYKEMDMASIRKLAKTLCVSADRTDTKEILIEKIEAYGKDTAELDKRSPQAEQSPNGNESFKYAI